MSRILVYDGDCPMCRWISRRFAQIGLVDEGDRRPFQEFEGDEARLLVEAGIRNEMLVLEESSGEIRAGVDGFRWLLERTPLRALATPLGWAPVRRGLSLLYRVVAYNRRVLAPPSAGVVCECDPDPHRGYRAAFLVMATLFVFGASAVCGVALDGAFGVAGPEGVAGAVSAAVVGLVLLGRLATPASAFHLVGNALMVVAVTLVAALPAVFLALLAERTAAWLLLLMGGMMGIACGARSLVWRARRARSGSTASGSSR
ncbi:MAG: DCC1-like thiol-disulfide oxidoreductase family protein [Thermoanaerobaculia bacterium]|nr:DCC1-like thiol-disulfide oxidoreductase family protein [Thermoanaerobaculia bacterium]